MKLTDGVKAFMNKYSFTQFVLAIQSAGFISSRLIKSQMTLIFAYTLYLMLHDDHDIPKEKVKFYVGQWYVLSTLTGRYTGSPETAMEADIRRIKEKWFMEVLAETEAAELSDAFWDISLVQKMETSSVSSPYLNVYLAAQVHMGDRALFTNYIKVSDLIELQGEVHHIFPKQYLAKHGITEKSKYNQIANYAYLDAPINKAISDDAPSIYFSKAIEAAKTEEQKTRLDKAYIQVEYAKSYYYYQLYMKFIRQDMASLVKNVLNANADKHELTDSQVTKYGNRIASVVSKIYTQKYVDYNTFLSGRLDNYGFRVREGYINQSRNLRSVPSQWHM
jgi:hypothetical protein